VAALLAVVVAAFLAVLAVLVVLALAMRPAIVNKA
jgi:hypothetical protein